MGPPAGQGVSRFVEERIYRAEIAAAEGTRLPWRAMPLVCTAAAALLLAAPPVAISPPTGPPRLPRASVTRLQARGDGGKAGGSRDAAKKRRSATNPRLEYMYGCDGCEHSEVRRAPAPGPRARQISPRRAPSRRAARAARPIKAPRFGIGRHSLTAAELAPTEPVSTPRAPPPPAGRLLPLPARAARRAAKGALGSAARRPADAHPRRAHVLPHRRGVCQPVRVPPQHRAARGGGRHRCDRATRRLGADVPVARPGDRRAA